MYFSANSDQIQLFKTDGFIFVSQLFDPSETEALMHVAKSDREIRQEAYARRDSAGGETKLALRNDLAESPYSAIVRSQRVAGSMSKLLEDEVYHYHHKMMLKEPRVGGAWEWHQDYGYWYNNGCLFPDMASCLIAIDRATKANGCLVTKPRLNCTAWMKRSSAWNSCIVNWSLATRFSFTPICCIALMLTRAINLAGH